MEGKEDVMTNEMRRRCAAGGPALSTRDQKIASAAMVVSSLFFAIVYIVLSKVYHHIPAVEALGYTSFPAIFLLYSNFAYLKRRHWPIQLLFVVTGIVMLYSFMWGTCIVAARL
jgi:drug/metabolite transporter (DMT)-like permease